MRAYYFDNIPGDQRLPHDSMRPVSEEHLKALNILHWTIQGDNWEEQINAIARERKYKNRDEINITKEGLGDAYEEKIKSFYQECVELSSYFATHGDLIVGFFANRHLHEDEEIRYIISGAGFFDVRGKFELTLSLLRHQLL